VDQRFPEKLELLENLLLEELQIGVLLGSDCVKAELLFCSRVDKV
jgi:hypothetical protein